MPDPCLCLRRACARRSAKVAALAGARPDDLAALVVRRIVERAPGLAGDGAAGHVDEVVFGNANGAGEENRNVGRMAALSRAFRRACPARPSTGCAARASTQPWSRRGPSRPVTLTWCSTGGVESMTRAPGCCPRPRSRSRRQSHPASTTLGWRLVNPAMPAEWTVSSARRPSSSGRSYGISRDRQDAFAERSHRLADAAWDEGSTTTWSSRCPTWTSRDESIRPDTPVTARRARRPSAPRAAR